MLRNVQLLFKVIRMITARDSRARVRRFYELVPPNQEFIGRSTTYLNVGYWAPGCDSQDEASIALAERLAAAAEFHLDQTILDVGFGYGDQDFAWLRENKVRKVFGVNLTPHQVAAARERAAREGLLDRTDFRIGSATELPFESASFDRVVALESAFHFFPRSAFFEEAFRVLRPGGKLCTADIIPVDVATQRSSFQSGPLSWIRFGTEDANWHNSATYLEQLAEAGFTGATAESIRDRTWEPWRQNMVTKFASPGYQEKVGKSAFKGISRNWGDQPRMKKELELLDYVISVAHKP